ncbi:MFS transporter [Microbacterium sp. p3-SID338]|uniref:MFS transporter n=1 Tax=unclassified Microbacterium TaxID=2609290 RepID=UPI000787FDC0|nr:MULTISPECIES: MFS transporter [unclassified Microbacterium]KYJ97954.1 transporter [Microbacterium sp. CH1]MCT1396926.1 MFS transporter [Microbacterium sp. p3-SID338]PMC04409.1 MFS transporter [Microbacterium sp. UMB0228]
MSSSTRSPARWWGLTLIALAQFMVIMDASIIGVALPRMQEDLGFTPNTLSWVFNAYVIALGGLLLLGGRLSDLFGPRRMFATGWVILAAGSLVAGFAGDVVTELVGRVLQGAGSALIAPAALTLLMMLFGQNPRELTKAMAFYGAAAPAGGTAGVFLGGVITEFASWPWVFFINVPIAVLVLALMWRALPGGTLGAKGSVDVLGALTVTLGLAALVYGIVRAEVVGWAAAETWIAIGAGVVLLVLFLIIQRVKREPLMRLSIFRSPNLGAANLAQVLLGAAWIPMWFFLNLYLQQVLGFSAFPAGAALLPMTALIMLGMIVLAPRVIAAFGPKMPIVLGLVVLAAGLGWMAFIRPDGNYWVDAFGPSLVVAFGQALAFIPSLQVAISAAPPEEGGLASGIVNTSYQVGSAIGLAAVSAVAAGFGASHLGDAAALTSGYSAAFVAAGGIALVGALLVAVLFRTRRPDRTVETISTRTL